MRQFIFAIFITIIITSCQNTSCPSFPDILENYFPYSKGEVITFINQNKDTLLLTVSNNWTSQPYTVKWNCKCSCEASMGFKSEPLPDQLLTIEGQILVYPEINTSVLSIDFINSQINSDSFSLTVENVNPFSAINMNLFGDTIEVYKTDYYRISMVKIIYGHGLCEFYDEYQNCKWIKIN